MGLYPIGHGIISHTHQTTISKSLKRISGGGLGVKNHPTIGKLSSMFFGENL